MKVNKDELLKLRRFLEEFSWLMSDYSKMDFRKIANSINSSYIETSELRNAVGNYEVSNPNVHFLTGVLPTLFLDDSIFKTNEEIAEFSESVLDIKIPGYDKKSKFEIIGRIVCETSTFNKEEKLYKLVEALKVLLGDIDKKERLMKYKRNDSFSWNYIIQDLVEGKDVS